MSEKLKSETSWALRLGTWGLPILAVILFDNVKKNFTTTKHKLIPKIGDYFRLIHNI